MNSQHKNGKDNRSLDLELDQLNQLYHSGDPIEPPDMIDQAVLNKARLAVKPKNGWLDFGWIHAVTSVALVVLTLSIFTAQRQTGEFEPMPDSSADSSPAAVAPVPAPAPATEAEAPVAGNPVLPQSAAAQQAPEALKEDKQQSARARDQSGAQRQMRAPASVVPAPRQAAKKTNNEKGLTLPTEQLDSAVALEPPSISSQQLLLDRILALKQAGDVSWETELADFKKRYPDFPLPEELQLEN